MRKPTVASIPLTPMPYQELIAALGLGLKLPTTARSATNHAAANDSTIPESSRNNTLTSLAGVMRRKGFDQGAIEAALLKHNAERCNPPLLDNEVKAIAASVSRYPPTGTVDLLSMTDVGNAEARGAHPTSCGWRRPGAPAPR